VEIRGPAPSPIEKIKDEYRFQIWYFCARTTQVVPELVRLQQTVNWPDDTQAQWDRFFDKDKHKAKPDAFKKFSDQDVKDIQQFLFDHAADSDQPETCG
jgi:hypothetical protein